MFEFKKFKKFKAKYRKFVLRKTFRDYSLQLIQTKKSWIWDVTLT